MRKRIFTAFLLLCVALTLLPTAALAAVTASGTCGANLTWTLDDAGTLTISGTGAMSHWTDGATRPWNELQVKTVIIGDGITNVF